MPRKLSGALAVAFLALSGAAVLAQTAAPASDAGTMSESAPIEAKVYGLSADDLLNVRATASATGLVLARIPNGSQLTRFECAEFGGYPWCRVELKNPEGLVGWTPARYLNVALPDGIAASPAPKPRPEEEFDRSQIVAGILPDPLPILNLGRAAAGSAENEVQTVLLSPAPDRGVERLLAVDAGRESDKVDRAGSAFALALAVREQPFTGELYTPGEFAAQPADADETARAVSAIPVPTPRPARPGENQSAKEFLADVPDTNAEIAQEEQENIVASAADVKAQGSAAAVRASTVQSAKLQETQVEMASLPPSPETRHGRAAETATASTAEEPAPAASGEPAADSAAPVPERHVAVAQSNGAREKANGTTAAIPCARYVGQPMMRCEAQVVRSGSGDADVTIFWPDGGKRVLQFRDGRPEGSNTSQEFRFTREADLNMIRVGLGERFEILDAIPLGQ